MQIKTNPTPRRQGAKTPRRKASMVKMFPLGDLASWRLGVCSFALVGVSFLPVGAALAQGGAAGDEPSLDDLLGTGDEPGEGEPAEGEDAVDDSSGGPELNRELERRLNGEEAADQFAQAIQDMAEAASRLGEDADAGIDTQRLQDEIILKLEQIISSAQNSEEQSSSSSSSQPGEPEARPADQGGQPQPGQQPGEQPGQGEQPGEGEGEGQQPGDASQPGGDQPGNGDPRRGEINEQALSMEELREGEWGNLPPRLRDELAESLGESFNPVYRSVTEAYYRRLAELSRQEAEGE